MAKTSSIVFMLILLGIVLGFLFAFVILNKENTEIKKQINSSDKLAVKLENQITGNCSKVYSELHLSNMKLCEGINLSQINNEYANQQNIQKINYSSGLLSPRIYSGILEPRSFLITNFEPLKQGIQSYLQEQNINASIYIENLRNGVNIGINEDEGYFPASLNKLPIAILIMQKIEDGKLSLDSNLSIEDNDRTDSYGTLYLTKEKQLPVRVLLEKMLRESDNTAFSVLFEHVDRSDLARLLDYYSIKENAEYPFRRLEYESGTNLVTPILMYNIFSSLYLSTVLYAQDAEYILSLLTKTTDFDINARAELPDNVPVADKFGEYYLDNDKLFHDCGIMYVGASRIFYCIMTKDLEPDDAKEAIGYIVNHIYNYVVDTRARLDVYRDRIMGG